MAIQLRDDSRPCESKRRLTEAATDVNEEQSEAATAPDLITHVAVAPMNVHDGTSLEPALADAEAR